MAGSGRKDIYKILLVVDVSFLDFFFSFKQILMEQMTWQSTQKTSETWDPRTHASRYQLVKSDACVQWVSAGLTQGCTLWYRVLELVPHPLSSFPLMQLGKAEQLPSQQLPTPAISLRWVWLLNDAWREEFPSTGFTLFSCCALDIIFKIPFILGEEIISRK